MTVVLKGPLLAAALALPMGLGGTAPQLKAAKLLFSPWQTQRRN